MSFLERINKNNIGLKSRITILVFLVLVLLNGVYYVIIKNSETYIKAVQDLLEKNIPFEVRISGNDIFLLPSPGIRFENIEIYDASKELAGSAERLDFHLQWSSLFSQKPAISSITVIDGKLDLSLVQQEFNKRPGQNSSGKNPDISNIFIRNFILVFKMPGKEKLHTLYIEKAELDRNFFGKGGDIVSVVTLDNQEIEIEGDYSYKNSLMDFNNLEMDVMLDIERFSLAIVSDYLDFFADTNFSTAETGGSYHIKKPVNGEISVDFDGFIAGLALKSGGKADLYGKAVFAYSPKEKILFFRDMEAEWPGKVKATGYGQLNFHEKFSGHFGIDASYGDYDSIIYIVRLFLVELKKEPKGSSSRGYFRNSSVGIDINGRNFYVMGHYIPEGKVSLKIENPYIYVTQASLLAYDGKLDLKGTINFKNTNIYNFVARAGFVDAERLIRHYTKDKIIRGRVFADMRFQSYGNNEYIFKNNLKASGSFSVQRGQLLGYANIMKPVATLGKFMNVLGPSGDSLDFENISGKFRVAERTVFIEQARLKGVGIDARGTGRVGFNRMVDMKVKVGFAGAVGKLFYVPVIYKGKYPNNIAYVDPVWLTTVYIGFSVLAGPAGATVGSIAGSAVSDFFDATKSSIKNLFGKSGKPGK